MAQKALAILLAFFWIVLSGVDLVEDFDFETRDAPSASSSPDAAKPVKLTSNQVQFRIAHSLDCKAITLVRDPVCKAFRFPGRQVPS